jgi:uncharacterized protein Yka (UPF0111/DUF47 family)
MNDPLEQQVLTSLEEIQARYQQLNSLADKILQQDTAISMMDDAMLDMKQQRESLERLTTAAQPLNNQYRATREHASPAVKRLTQSVGELMQSLLMKISNLERNAQSIHNNLLPKVHDGVRAVQMKNAYGKHH